MELHAINKFTGLITIHSILNAQSEVSFKNINSDALLDNIFLCSATTPPGRGVHGMYGLRAANLALIKNNLV
jgi:phytoene dehydrogenase-like protein